MRSYHYWAPSQTTPNDPVDRKESTHEQGLQLVEYSSDQPLPAAVYSTSSNVFLTKGALDEGKSDQPVSHTDMAIH